VYTFSELRPSLPGALKQVVRISVLGPDEFGPDGVLLLVKFPNPLFFLELFPNPLEK
jgi:hypothetical protein